MSEFAVDISLFWFWKRFTLCG